MTDTLASRALIGVMTPAMNTVVQPELELLRPAGVTNQMQAFPPGRGCYLRRLAGRSREADGL